MGQTETHCRKLCSGNGVHAGLVAFAKCFLHLLCVSLTAIQQFIPGAWRFVDAALLVLVDVFRLGSGLIPAANLSACKRPAKRLVLYEYEPSPWCRRVRETLSVLRLDYTSLPCPRETLSVNGYCKDSRFRNELKSKGKKLQFPYLEDPNTGTQLHESSRIVEYLWKEYGSEAKAPLNYRIATYPPIAVLTHVLACCCRPLMSCGVMRCPSKRPESLLELYGCEASPCVRRVRETLSCLELPHVTHVSGAPTPENVTSTMEGDSANSSAVVAPLRQALGVRLVDPNTKTELNKVSEIVSYLREKYAVEPAPTASWLEYGTGCGRVADSKMT